jgi:hydroxyacylglutathione hydrolase
MIAGYRLAASKMISEDYYVTMYKGNELNEIPMRVHLWLENVTRIDLKNYSLRIFHTPGHRSGLNLHCSLPFDMGQYRVGLAGGL